jgi:hypothetical protein
MFQTKVVEKNQNTHFIVNNFFSPENRTVYEIMWENMASGLNHEYIPSHLGENSYNGLFCHITFNFLHATVPFSYQLYHRLPESLL